MKSSRFLSPLTFYLFLILLITLFSWIGSIYNLSIDQSGEDSIVIQNLFSAEGIRWFLQNMLFNFTTYTPLGIAFLSILSIGLLFYSGFIESFLELLPSKLLNHHLICLVTILVGILSPLMGENASFLLIPLAAILFQFIGLSPVAGIIVSFVSVTIGSSSNLFNANLNIHELSASEGFALFGVNILSFNQSLDILPIVGTLLLTALLYLITRCWLLPVISIKYPPSFLIQRTQLSKKRKRAFWISSFWSFLFLILLLVEGFTTNGIFRSITGNPLNSTLLTNLIPLLSLILIGMSCLYGALIGKYKKEADLIDDLINSLKLIAPFLLFSFVYALVMGSLNFSNMDRYLSLHLANMESLLPQSILQALIGATSILNPFTPAMPFFIAILWHCDKSIAYADVVKFTWGYAVTCLIGLLLLLLYSWRFI